MANNPFVLNVADALRSDGMPLDITATGPSPSRIGPEMIAIPEGGEVTVEATVTNLALVCLSTPPQPPSLKANACAAWHP